MSWLPWQRASIVGMPLLEERTLEQVIDVLACDVGYFAVKTAYRVRGNIEAFSFPSVVARCATREALRSNMELFGENAARVEVNVGDTTYAVNTGQTSLPSSAAVRAEVDDFPRTPKYAALILACLKKIRATKIRCLVLGLPVHTLERHSGYLKSTFCGALCLDGRSTCTVERVVVLPQPLGTYAHLRDRHLIPASRQVSTCIADIGWHTTDVVVFQPDGSLDVARSMGLSGGAARVVREVARLAGEQTGTRLENLDRVDHALRTGERLLHFGKHVDLAPHLRAALMDTYEVAHAVLTGLKTSEDLQVFVSGGGARFYMDTLSNALGLEIQLVERSHMANCLGFLAAAEAVQRQGAR